jgi:hypothetical protein
MVSVIWDMLLSVQSQALCVLLFEDLQQTGTNIFHHFLLHFFLFFLIVIIFEFWKAVQIFKKIFSELAIYVCIYKFKNLPLPVII